MVVTVLDEIAPGIHRWTAPHPEWRPRHPWAREVASFALVADPGVVLIDPLAPAGEDRLWPALDDLIETSGARRLAVFVTIHYHVRSAAAVRDRYGDRLPTSVHGHKSLAGEVPLDPIDPDTALPGGARAYAIGSPRRREMPIHIPAARALAFGDSVVGVDGQLRVWEDLEGAKRRPWYESRHLPTLQPLLDLDVDHVLVTHGPPAVGDGAAKLRDALASAPWHYRTG